MAMTPINLLRVVALAKLYKENYTSIPKTSPLYNNRFTTSSSYSTPYNSLPRNAPKPYMCPNQIHHPYYPHHLAHNLKTPMSRGSVLLKCS